MRSAFVCAVLAVLLAATAFGKYDTHFMYGIDILATHNVTLKANGYLPKPKTSGELFPAIIFPNSWDCPQIEYIVKALNFAEKGYVTLEYETRGWFLSGGHIDTAGPLDRDDTLTVFDYVVSNAEKWNVNISRIAFAGISYGAGLSLMAAGHNPKVRTAVALSGWDRFVDGFYYYRTPAAGQLGSLLHGGETKGHINPELKVFYNNIINHQNMSQVHPFVHDRSPESLYLEKYNERKTPLFLSNNMNDRLFFPQTKTHFYTRLQGPKFQLLNQGMHAEPEGLGLIGLPDNYIWGKVQKWLDYWLKDEDNGIMEEPPIQVQCGNSIFSPNYTTFTAWPDPVKADPLTLYFGARGDAMYGVLNATSSNGASDTITYTAKPGLNEGPSDKKASLGELPTFDFTKVAPANTSIVYISAPFEQDTEVCGVPVANLSLTVPSDNKWQVYGFMYQVEGNTGTMFGDVMYTSWATDGEEKHTLRTVVDKVTGASVSTADISVNLRAVCRIMKAGSSFGVGFVLANQGYSPSATTGLNVGFNYDASTSFTIPRVHRQQ